MITISKTRLLAYILYTCLALFIIKLLIPVGDHNFGMGKVVLLLLFGTIFTFLFLMSASKSIFRIIKKQGSFRWYTAVVFFVTLTIALITSEADYGKFWTSVRLVGTTNYEQYSKDGELILFNNGTFEARVIHVDFGEVYTGDYQISHDTVTLIRPNVITKTENTFCNRYVFDVARTTLLPLQSGFREIQIQQQGK
ncbi:hypothetical protein ACLI08_08425 [Flavobacterium sp. RNTU_13]|uniref:hypothetical protein n=1 Tax=Flavobacterium sp. RNTU_13 TaxID=3375145 RepID=UPI00398769EA